MPDLLDIAQRAADRPPVARLHEARCLMARDVGAHCTACADACPVGAVAVRPPARADDRPYGSVSPTGTAGPLIDDEACVRCGACVVACPVGALLPLPPLDDAALLARVAALGRNAAARTTEGEELEQGDEAEAPVAPAADSGETRLAAFSAPASALVGIACERIAQALRLDEDRVVVLPCLGWVDAALLVHLACSGAERIALPLDACASCPTAGAVAHVRPAVADAQRICDAWGIGTAFAVGGADAAKSLAADPDADAAGELTRRGLFSQAGSALVEAAKSETAKQLDALAGANAASDAAPPEPDARRWQLLDDLHAAGAPAAAVVPRAVAPRLAIDVDRCSGCAQCALFCPTGALRKAGKLTGGRTLLEFDPTRCRDCSVCEDTCRYGALACEETLAPSELFALDPREIAVPKRRVLPERR